MKTWELEEHIRDMPASKRNTLQGMAADKGQTLIEFLRDLYQKAPATSSRVIVISNSVVGDINQVG